MATEAQRTRQRGYTFMELMMTVVVIGIIASVAIPSYQKTVRRSKLRAAADILRTIQAGEQVYFVFHNRQYREINATANTQQWADIYMDNPNIGSGRAMTGLGFTVTPDNNPGPGAQPTFVATAGFVSFGNLPVMTIDQTGQPINCQPPSGNPGGFVQADCP